MTNRTPDISLGWWSQPCEYGHFDCSYEDRGPCGDEAFAPDAGEFDEAIAAADARCNEMYRDAGAAF